MQIISASAHIEAFTEDLEQVIEAAGRTCWKSEEKISKDSAPAFIERIKGFKHESVLEHGAITVRFICDRGVSHELVRHRLAAFSQESTRYCNYSKDKFGQELTFIRPLFFQPGTEKYRKWVIACQAAEASYLMLLDDGATAQEARSVLPNSLKTEIVMTTNPREWRHVFRMRCDKAAHPQMREVMLPLFDKFCEMWPSLFDDVEFAGRKKKYERIVSVGDVGYRVIYSASSASDLEINVVEIWLGENNLSDSLSEGLMEDIYQELVLSLEQKDNA